MSQKGSTIKTLIKKRFKGTNSQTLSKPNSASMHQTGHSLKERLELPNAV